MQCDDNLDSLWSKEMITIQSPILNNCYFVDDEAEVFQRIIMHIYIIL